MLLKPWSAEWLFWVKTRVGEATMTAWRESRALSILGSNRTINFFDGKAVKL